MTVFTINTIFTSGLIDQETALGLLKRGEILGDEVDVEEVLAASELEQQKGMEQQLAIAQGDGGNAFGDNQDQPPNG